MRRSFLLSAALVKQDRNTRVHKAHGIAKGNHRMNKREDYFSQYCHKNRRKKKIIRVVKRITVTALAVCMACSTGFLLHKLPLDHVFAAPEKEIAGEESTVILNGFQLSTLSLDDIFGEAEAGEPAPAQIEVKKNGVPVIFLDAGHGGADAGCVSGDVQEKTINLAIAKKVQTKLEEMGYSVIMARERDTYITKENRVKLANALQADIYVSIHQNDSEVATVKGMEVWYAGEDTMRDNKRLALLIGQQTAKSLGIEQRELRGDADFHVTGSTKMPSCLIETGFLSNKEERELLLTEEYQEQIAAGIVQGIVYYFHPKTMYLTFDDGPTEENTARVLDILKERGIKATFFLVGENVRKHPEMAKRIVAEGHTIGIHCDNHDYENVYRSVDSFIEDFETAYQTIYEVTGVEAKLFRFPGGSVNHYNKKINDAIIQEMTERGYIYFDWNASLDDAVGSREPEELVASGVQTTLGREKVVMLAHDVVYNTGICLEDLLDALPEYAMKPLSEEVEPIRFK